LERDEIKYIDIGISARRKKIHLKKGAALIARKIIKTEHIKLKILPKYTSVTGEELNILPINIPTA
jgi:hypothetical protein